MKGWIVRSWGRNFSTYDTYIANENRPLEVVRELSLVDDASAYFRSSIDFVGDEDGQADAVAFSFELDLVPPFGVCPPSPGFQGDR